MRQINVPVEDAVYEAAKAEAARKGMLFRFWVERVIREACEPADDRPTVRAVRDITYEPIDE